MALDRQADHTLANKAALLLLRGRFEEGFDLYEYRWAKGKKPVHKLPLPYLDRIEDLNPGEKILVWDDQALGDVVQFSRYLPLLAERGGKVVLLARKSAHRLLSGLGEEIEIVERVPSLEGFVRHVALGSLPARSTPILRRFHRIVPICGPRRKGSGNGGTGSAIGVSKSASPGKAPRMRALISCGRFRSPHSTEFPGSRACA